MTCRPDRRLILFAAAVLALVAPLSAAPGRNPLAGAAAALDRGDGIAAEIAARRALDAGLTRERVAAFAGEAALLQGDFASARAWLGPARFARDSAQRGFHALAVLEMREGHPAAAARAFDLALAQGPAGARLWVDIGRFRYAIGQHDLAVVAADRALVIDPGNPRALEFRGQLERDASGVRRAIVWFERALVHAPDDLGLLGEYAATLGEAGENRAMLRVARRMVELDPHHPRAYFLQAVLAARARHDDLARRLLSRTADAYDEVPAALLLAGILELRTGSPALAAEQFAALARRQPDNARVQLLLGRALLAAGEAGEVVVRLGPAAARADASPYLLTLVGRAHEQLGRRVEAAPLLDRAAAVEPVAFGVLAAGTRAARAEGAGAAVPRLRALLADRRMAAALALAAHLGAQHPGSADVARLRGDATLLAGDPDAALALYAAAAAIRRDRSLVERMAAAQRLLGRDAEALALVADHVARNPADAPALALLGRLHAARGDWPAAAKLLGRASSLGAAGDPRLLADLAQAQLAAGAVGAARRSARAAYALQRANPQVAEVLRRTLQGAPAHASKVEALQAKTRRMSASPALAQL